MPHVRWAAGPPGPPLLPHVRWIVARSTQGVYAVLTARALIGAYTHWETPTRAFRSGHRVPCLSEHCEHCGRGRLGTRYWWASACGPRSPSAAILELSEGAACQLAALAPDPHSLRGLRVHVYRRDLRPRAPQEVRLVEAAAELPYELPAPFDVRPHLEHFWGVQADAWSEGPPAWTPRLAATATANGRANP